MSSPMPLARVVAVLVLGIIGTAPLAAAPKDSGPAGSDERRNWCLQMLQDCQRGVEGECAQSGDPSSCRQRGYASCDAQFAPTPDSECLNKARLLQVPSRVPGLRLQLAPGR